MNTRRALRDLDKGLADRFYVAGNRFPGAGITAFAALMLADYLGVLASKEYGSLFARRARVTAWRSIGG